MHCSATRHQHTHSSRPTPNYTKDTICYICKEIIKSIAPEDGRVSPKHVRAESTQINTQKHEVGKLIHNSNQNARYNYPKFPKHLGNITVHIATCCRITYWTSGKHLIPSRAVEVTALTRQLLVLWPWKFMSSCKGTMTTYFVAIQLAVCFCLHRSNCHQPVWYVALLCAVKLGVCCS